MKYKFKPQTAILVAGMLAATYASACYYQQTSAVCYVSGDTVDTILWSGGAVSLGTKPVIASSDWLVNATGSSGYFTWDSQSGGPSYSDPLGDGGGLPEYCSGPAHFLDFSGHSTSVNSWVANSADYNGNTGYFHSRFAQYGGTLVSGTVNTSSSTCTP